MAVPPRRVNPKNPKLLKIHLRYHPPGIILEYLDAYSKPKEKIIDLLDDICPGADIGKLGTELLNSEPLFCTQKHRVKVFESLETLKDKQVHDFSKKYFPTNTIKAHSLPLTGVAFSKDGNRVATSCLGSACKVWNAETGRDLATLVGHEDSVTSIHFNSSGDQILTSSHDGTLRLWWMGEDNCICCKSVLNSRTSETGHQKKGRVLFSKYSPDYLLAVSATDEKVACIHNLNHGVLQYKFTPELGDSQDITCLNMDRTGTLLLASPHHTCDAAIFDLRCGDLVETLESHEMETTKAIFDFMGTAIATASLDSTVKIWDTRMLEEPVHTLCACQGEVLDVEFDASGKCVAAGTALGKLLVWNLQCGKLVFVKHIQKSPTTKVAFSPTGAIVLGGNEHGMVNLYNTELGTCLQSFPDHTREIINASFSYDSQQLMTASKDKTVRLYKHTTILL